jgi:hypothetical protein
MTPLPAFSAFYGIFIPVFPHNSVKFAKIRKKSCEIVTNKLKKIHIYVIFMDKKPRKPADVPGWGRGPGGF